MLNLDDVTKELKELTDTLAAELAKFQEKQTKAGAKRIRVQTIAQAKVAKTFRELSVRL